MENNEPVPLQEVGDGPLTLYWLGFADGFTKKITNVGFADLTKEEKNQYTDGYCDGVFERLGI